MPGGPDYASYSLADLLDARERIDREKFPARYEALEREIERRERSGEAEAERRQEKRASRKAKGRLHGVLALAAGLLVLFNYVLVPVAFTVRSRHWPAVACVAAREYGPHPSQVSLAYRYTFGGQSFTGRRLSSTESSRKMSSWLREYPNGKAATCFVNPAKPSESTLTWGYSGLLLFFGAWSAFAIGFGLQALRHPETIKFKRRP